MCMTSCGSVPSYMHTHTHMHARACLLVLGLLLQRMFFNLSCPTIRKHTFSFVHTHMHARAGLLVLGLLLQRMFLNLSCPTIRKHSFSFVHTHTHVQACLSWACCRSACFLTSAAQRYVNTPSRSYTRTRTCRPACLGPAVSVHA